MWSQAVGWMLALLGVAASANLLVGRRTRSLRALKLEAELHQAMPDGDGRVALRNHLDRQVWAYVDAKEQAQPWTAKRVGLLAYHAVTLAAPFVAGSILILNDELKPWMSIVVTVAVAVAGTGILIDSRMMAKTTPRKTRATASDR